MVTLSLYLHKFIGMAARQKHRRVGNPYNLPKNVEILNELQLESDNVFLMNFLYNLSIYLGSNSRLYSDSDIDSIVDNFFLMKVLIQKILPLWQNINMTSRNLGKYLW